MSYRDSEQRWPYDREYKPNAGTNGGPFPSEVRVPIPSRLGAAALSAGTFGRSKGALSTSVENGGTLPTKGTVCVQWSRCGRPGCRCSRGRLHGPYHCLFWREGGRLRKRDIRRADVEAVRHATAEWRRLHPPTWSTRQALVELRRLLRGLDAPGG